MLSVRALKFGADYGIIHGVFFPRKFTQKSFKINKFHYETVTLQITGYPVYRGDDLIIDIS